jgi:hypothetical protein
MPAPYKPSFIERPIKLRETVARITRLTINSKRGPQIKSAPSAQAHFVQNCGSLADRAQSPLHRRNLPAT